MWRQKIGATITVFPPIDSAGTILFLGSKVRVVIKGRLYLRAGSIS